MTFKKQATPVVPEPKIAVEPAETSDTPYIIYLTKQQLECVLELISAPATLSGAEIVKRGILIETVNQAVPVTKYNLAIVQRVLAEQKAFQDQEDAKKVWAAREEQKASGVKAVPVMADKPENFKPKVPVKTAPAKKAPVKKAAPKKTTPPKKVPEKKAPQPPPKKTPLKKATNPKYTW